MAIHKNHIAVKNMVKEILIGLKNEGMIEERQVFEGNGWEKQIMILMEMEQYS